MYLQLRSGINNSFVPTLLPFPCNSYNSLKGIDKDIPKLSDSSLTKVIVFGDSKYSDFQNHHILNSAISFIIDSKRFDCSLL